MIEPIIKEPPIIVPKKKKEPPIISKGIFSIFHVVFHNLCKKMISLLDPPKKKISLLDKVEIELENSRSDHVPSPIASKLCIFLVNVNAKVKQVSPFS